MNPLAFVLAAVGLAHAPVGYGVAAETSARTFVDAAPTGFAGADAFVVWRVLPALELSLRYQLSVMLPSGVTAGPVLWFDR